jgi:hypothetical protein
MRRRRFRSTDRRQEAEIDASRPASRLRLRFGRQSPGRQRGHTVRVCTVPPNRSNSPRVAARSVSPRAQIETAPPASANTQRNRPADAAATAGHDDFLAAIIEAHEDVRQPCPLPGRMANSGKARNGFERGDTRLYGVGVVPLVSPGTKKESGKGKRRRRLQRAGRIEDQTGLTNADRGRLECDRPFCDKIPGSRGHNRPGQV